MGMKSVHQMGVRANLIALPRYQILYNCPVVSKSFTASGPPVLCS